MKRTSRSPKIADELRPEYSFDYSTGRPNRFAARMSGTVVAVVLEPDVAEVFDSSEAVNRMLRSVISAIPKSARRKAGDRSRRKTG
jgi:hypothetical protein